MSRLVERRREVAALDIERAALAYLAEDDADSVTVEELAVAAGISRRTFYRYFDTTDDVIAAMPKRTVRRIANALRTRPQAEPLKDAFLASIRSAANAVEEIEISKLTRKVQRRSPEAWSRAVQRLRAYGVATFADILAERFSAQGRDPSFAHLTAEMLVALLVQVPGQIHRSGRDVSIEDFERALHAVADNLGAGPAKTAKKSARKRPV